MGFPGVPPLLNKTSASSVPLVSSDAPGLLGQSAAGTRWGIYQNGKAVVLADNITAFDYKKDWRVSNYPQEQGAFQSYNKVTMPYDARITMTKGGKDTDRQTFLKQIDTVAASFDLYDIVTPDKIYKNTNVSHVDYSRTASNGVGLLTIDIWLIEIRVTATQQFSTTKNANSADPVTPGTIQPRAPTISEAAFAAKFHAAHPLLTAPLL